MWCFMGNTAWGKVSMVMIALALAAVGFVLRYHYQLPLHGADWLMTGALAIVLLVTYASGKISLLAQWNWKIWLFAALMVNIFTLWLGVENQGAIRYLDLMGWQFRGSFWSLLLIAAALGQAPMQDKLSLYHRALIPTALLVESLLFMAQPDLYAQLMLVIVVMMSALLTDNRYRWILLGCAVGIIVMSIQLLLHSNYRLHHLIQGWLEPDTSPLDFGYVLMQSRKIIQQAEWLSSGNSRYLLKADVDQYSLPMLSHWLGNLGSVLLVFCMFALFWLLLCRLQRLSDSARQIAVTLLALWSVNQLMALLAPLGLVPLMGHFGVAILSLNGMTLLTVVLLCIAWPNAAKLAEESSG